jgi:polyhydroxyalkanoate synthesis regulator protein
MARRGEVFVVQDTTTGEDITQSVLGQIIVAQAVQTESLVPSEFMRRLLILWGYTSELVGLILRFFASHDQQRKYAQPNGPSRFICSQTGG